MAATTVERASWRPSALALWASSLFIKPAFELPDFCIRQLGFIDELRQHGRAGLANQPLENAADLLARHLLAIDRRAIEVRVADLVIAQRSFRHEAREERFHGLIGPVVLWQAGKHVA